MGAFNKTLVRDGVMLAAEGLQPSSKGARISYAGARPVVTDGPFTETKELVAGFWLLQARSKEELVERFARSLPLSTRITSPTTCYASYSSRATRCSRSKHAWP